MIRAYDKLYLNDARRTLSNAMDYAVNSLGYEAPEFYHMFLRTDLCDRFEKGDPFIISGHSGTELAIMVAERVSGTEIDYAPVPGSGASHGRSREYWCGWALAFYQWYTSCSLRRLEAAVPISSVMRMYDKYHEMDIMQFVDRVDDMRHQNDRLGSYLKRLREVRGYSQRELAQNTGIPLKTIQHYEQGTKSLAKANAVYILDLASALKCDPAELLGRA